MATTIFTFFATGGQTQLVYSATDWCQVRMGMETGGPVVVGTTTNLLPTSAGNGRQLLTDRDVVFVLAPADRIYIAANSPQRVGVTIESIPQITVEKQILAVLAAASGQSVAPAPVNPTSAPKWPFRF